MKRHLAALAVLALVFAPVRAFAVDVAPPRPGPNEIETMLKAHPPQPAAAPTIKPIALSKEGSNSTAQWEKMQGWLTVRNVTQPALYPVVPEHDKVNGTSVIIAPGGAFLTLSFDTEGMEEARYLASRGITCFVLTYRVDSTPRDVAGLVKSIMQRFGHLPPNMTHGGIVSPAQSLAQTDGLRAVAYVRSHAAEYSIDPNKIGLIGFSAGGMTAMNVATAYEPKSKPDFVGVIYGAMPRRAVPKDAPPVFIAVAADDPLLGHASVPIFDAWQQAGRSAELHIYAHGGHGFGMRRVGTSSDHWIDDFYDWLLGEHLATAAK